MEIKAKKKSNIHSYADFKNFFGGAGIPISTKRWDSEVPLSRVKFFQSFLSI